MSIMISTFQSDVTPPLGSPLCHGNCPTGIAVADPLTARGIVIQGKDRPVVLCAVDWVCISNRSHDLWREKLAEAAGTDVKCVTIHTTHPHDAPGTDLSTETILAEHGLSGAMYDPDFEKTAVEKTVAALRTSLRNPKTITHLAMGKATVEKFASNRRLLGRDNKVEFIRFSSCADKVVRNREEGVIDPMIRLLRFDDHEIPVASLTYYATHPQSFYRKGSISADTVGLARYLRFAEQPQTAHIHFCGAGGNIAAGKYNDGSPENRFYLAARLAAGMRKAWENAVKVPLKPDEVSWTIESFIPPLRNELIENKVTLENVVMDRKNTPGERVLAARGLAFLQRVHSGHKIDVPLLRIGPARILHMPGELFVEYQLAAQKMVRDRMICIAAYGDCGPGYIGTEIAYGQGSYETGPKLISRVGPEIEKVLSGVMRKLLL